jgi:hypothetical protein
VTGKEGAGSGFIVSVGGANYLVTNAHVAAGISNPDFKTLAGKKLVMGGAAIGVGFDIFAFHLGPEEQALPLMESVDQNARVGDQVVVLGNEEGAGVVTAIKGQIVGMGPDRVEVDAPFKPGNSGSTIIHLETGKVIGVATYARIKNYDPETRQVLERPEIRRFGYRVDTARTWEIVNPLTFAPQAAEMKAIDELTRALIMLAMDIMENGTIGRARHTHPVLRQQVADWLRDRGNPQTAEGAAFLDEKLVTFLKETCRADVAAAKPHMTYDHFRSKLEEETQQRDEMAEMFEKLIKEMGKKR